MSRHLYLHIGLPKTGTSAIQSFLVAEREALLEQNIYFPETHGDERHTFLMRAIGAADQQDVNAGMWRGEDPAVFLQEYLDAFKQDMKAAPFGITKVILSAEQFSRFKTAAEIIRLRDFLAPLFSGVTVIVYLRRQDAHFASFYTQALRLGNVAPPDVTHLLKHHHTYDYAEILGRWADAFGQDAVNVRLFERGADRSFDVLQDFASVCGITVPENPKPRPADANPAISLAGQHALRLLGAKMQAQTEQRRISGNAWHRICYHVTEVAPGRGWQPTREEAQYLVAQYADSNEAVRARWFPERASLFSQDFDSLPEYTELPAADDVLDVMAAAFIEVVRTAVRKEQELRVEKAMLADELGDSERCMDLLTKAVRRDGRDPEARVALAQMYLKSKEFRKAQVNIDAALEIDPTHRRARKLRQRLENRTVKSK